MITVVVSGGQTGADQAALDAAIKAGIPHGGWLPKGRLTEDGPLPTSYHLKEMPGSDYSKRTEQNVLDSDGTLIFSFGALTGGSFETGEYAKKHNKPWMFIDLSLCHQTDAVEAIHEWTQNHAIRVLNVAGPRASKDPNIYRAVFEIISKLLTH